MAAETNLDERLGLGVDLGKQLHLNRTALLLANAAKCVGTVRDTAVLGVGNQIKRALGILGDRGVILDLIHIRRAQKRRVFGQAALGHGDGSFLSGFPVIIPNNAPPRRRFCHAARSRVESHSDFWSQSATLSHTGKSRPFPSANNRDFGRKMSRCCRVAFYDHPSFTVNHYGLRNFSTPYHSARALPCAGLRWRVE